MVINSLENCLVAIIVNQMRGGGVPGTFLAGRVCLTLGIVSRLVTAGYSYSWHNWTPTSIKFFDWIVSEASRH